MTPEQKQAQEQRFLGLPQHRQLRVYKRNAKRAYKMQMLPQIEKEVASKLGLRITNGQIHAWAKQMFYVGISKRNQAEWDRTRRETEAKAGVMSYGRRREY